MKVQRKNGCIGERNLIPFIASGRVSPDQTERFIHKTYLEAWWRCLKLSKEFTQSCRTGIFTSEGAYKTYRMFGSIEDLSFHDWWMTKGHKFFGESVTTLQLSFYVQRKDPDVYEISVGASKAISGDLAGKEFGFWVDQLALLDQNEGLLSAAPLAWPIFNSRISYDAISQLLNIVEIHDQVIRNEPKTKLWQIGEQLKLHPKALVKPDDYLSDIPVKHKAMGQVVSNYLRKGRGLIENASLGIFPKIGRAHV